MSAWHHPRHPIISMAMALARRWCAGHVIDGAPALAHAVRVASAVEHYMPNAHPGLVAAALLHDAPEFAPPTVDLGALLTVRFGTRVACVVRALGQEHQRAGDEPVMPRDPWVLYVSTADKIVSIGSVLRQVTLADDADRYWRHIRRAFVARLPYFRVFHTLACPRLPAALAADLGRLVAAAEVSAMRPQRGVR